MENNKITKQDLKIGQKINHIKCDDLMTIISMTENMVTLIGDSVYGSFEIRRTKSSLLKFILKGELECITTN